MCCDDHNYIMLQGIPTLLNIAQSTPTKCFLSWNVQWWRAETCWSASYGSCVGCIIMGSEIIGCCYDVYWISFKEHRSLSIGLQKKLFNFILLRAAYPLVSWEGVYPFLVPLFLCKLLIADNNIHTPQIAHDASHATKYPSMPYLHGTQNPLPDCRWHNLISCSHPYIVVGWLTVWNDWAVLVEYAVHISLY